MGTSQIKIKIVNPRCIHSPFSVDQLLLLPSLPEGLQFSVTFVHFELSIEFVHCSAIAALFFSRLRHCKSEIKRLSACSENHRPPQVNFYFWARQKSPPRSASCHNICTEIEKVKICAILSTSANADGTIFDRSPPNISILCPNRIQCSSTSSSSAPEQRIRLGADGGWCWVCMHLPPLSACQILVAIS